MNTRTHYDVAIIGAGMSGLAAGIRLAHFGFAVRVPNEKLFHVNGTAREDFVPRPVGESTVADAALDAALQLVSQSNPGGQTR